MHLSKWHCFIRWQNRQKILCNMGKSQMLIITLVFHKGQQKVKPQFHHSQDIPASEFSKGSYFTFCFFFFYFVLFLFFPLLLIGILGAMDGLDLKCDLWDIYQRLGCQVMAGTGRNFVRQHRSLRACIYKGSSYPLLFFYLFASCSP